MNPTRNDLPEAARVAMIKVLNERLADAIDLKGQAKQAHWNVKGPDFYQLHLLFDQVAEVIEGHIDTIAERAVALGGVAEGTVRVVAERTTLSDYPLEIRAGMDHVQALADALARFGQAVRKGIDAADRECDKDTADLFTEVSRDVDKHLWFVEAHLHAPT